MTLHCMKCTDGEWWCKFLTAVERTSDFISCLGCSCSLLGTREIWRKENFISYITIHHQRILCSAASSHQSSVQTTNQQLVEMRLHCIKCADGEWWCMRWSSLFSIFPGYPKDYNYILGNWRIPKFVETAVKNSVSTLQKARCLYYKTRPVNAASVNMSSTSGLWEWCEIHKYAAWAKGTVLKRKYAAALVTIAKLVKLRTTWGVQGITFWSLYLPGKSLLNKTINAGHL
jgi:hypothetical protein